MEPTINEWENKDEFVEYLVENLIPDLKESGMEATAQDFESAVFFILLGDLKNELW